MKSQEKKITDLLVAAKQHDQHAYRELLDLHWNELYRFLIKRWGLQTNKKSKHSS